MNMTMDVQGLRQLDAALGELKKSTARNVLTRVGKKALEPMAATARALAPDDMKTPDPDLNTSIIVSTTRNTGRGKAAREHFAEVWMGPTPDQFPKAMVQEMGSSKMAPHAYMRPAFDQEAVGALDIIQRDLGAEIDKAAARQARKAGR